MGYARFEFNDLGDHPRQSICKLAKGLVVPLEESDEFETIEHVGVMKIAINLANELNGTDSGNGSPNDYIDGVNWEEINQEDSDWEGNKAEKSESKMLTGKYGWRVQKAIWKNLHY
ncbi:hypothetical protein VNO78_24234 [Psophocarpus tetragonolobus]|uniref:Uncharacterized protein n=1 Tax=Psophocarpus tetragonolobus TaxID=3891 RepID=A0AAN9S5S0_PSOTE